MSKTTRERLSSQEQGWVNEASPIFLELRGGEGALLKKAEGEGATIINLSDDELNQVNALVQATQEVILNNMGDTAKAKWDSTQAAKTACS